MPDSRETREESSPPANMLEIDFALVLARMIEAAKADPVQLRGSIYELARQKLRDQFVDEDPREVRRMIQALDVAIQGVEHFSQRQDDQRLALPGVRASDRPTPAISGARRSDILPARLPSNPGDESDDSPPSHREPVYVQKPPVVSVRVDVPPSGKRSFFPVRALLIVGVAAVVLSAGIYVHRHPALLTNVRKLVGAQQVAGPELAARPQRTVAAAPVGDAVPPAPAMAVDPLLPKTFGIYAIGGGQLFELEPLPGRVPDPRVAMSAAINSPSRTMVPDGKVRFVIYRRDSVSNAPDRAEVRVIAKVVSAMTFEPSGKPTVSAPQDSWVIRNISTGYRVAPVKDNPDMYEIRHESDDFVLSPGRYALVIKGAAYDFTISGQLTDPNQCLEQIQAVNGTFYSPCQKR